MKTNYNVPPCPSPIPQPTTEISNLPRGFQGRGCVPLDEICLTVPPKCPERHRTKMRSPYGNGAQRPQTTDLRPLWYFAHFRLCYFVD